jgi:hypothetical protein
VLTDVKKKKPSTILFADGFFLLHLLCYAPFSRSFAGEIGKAAGEKVVWL